MKRLAIFIVLASVFKLSYSQTPTTSAQKRFGKSNHASFSLTPGDQLIYQVDNNGNAYDFIVTVRKIGEIIQYDYEFTNPKKKGNVALQKEQLENSKYYTNIFLRSAKPANGSNSLWLSKLNYTELASTDMHTTMDMGAGLEKFERGNTHAIKIKYKGQEKLITVFELKNLNPANPEILWILTDVQNPLIIKFENAWKFTLKEVR